MGYRVDITLLSDCLCSNVRGESDQQPEEKRRNSVLADLLFISCSHTLAPSVFSFYDKYADLTGPERSEVKEDIDPRARLELTIQILLYIGPCCKYLYICVLVMFQNCS